MEKQIFVVRHAKSSWELDVKDFDRPLNDRGQRTAPMMAGIFKGIVNNHIQFISSPANRALTTAKIFHSEFGSDVPFILNEDLYYGSEDSYLESIQMVSDQYGAVVLFGHNPKVEDFSFRAVGSFRSNVPTCAIICFTSNAKTWSEVDWSNIKYTNHYFPKEQ